MLATITTTSEPWLYPRPSQDVALHFRDLKFWHIKSLTVISWLPSSLTLLLLPYLLLDILDAIRPLTSLFSPKSITLLNISLPFLFCLDLIVQHENQHYPLSATLILKSLNFVLVQQSAFSTSCRLSLKQFCGLHPWLDSHKYCNLGHLFTIGMN